MNRRLAIRMLNSSLKRAATTIRDNPEGTTTVVFGWNVAEVIFDAVCDLREEGFNVAYADCDGVAVIVHKA